MSMGQVVFSTGAAPAVTITSVEGDLRLIGWELSEFRAEAGQQSDLMAEQTADGIRLTCRSDANLSVPQQAHVMVQNVHGDVKVRALGGNLDFQTIGGSLTLRHTRAVTGGQVHGDVDAKHVDGALKVGPVSGSVSVRGVSGELGVEARGDVTVNQASQAIRTHAGGDVDLRRCLAPGVEYVVEAGGDIHLRAEPGLWARYEMQAGGEVIARVNDTSVEGNAKYQVVTLGSESGGRAQAHVMARAGGDVILGWEAATTDLDDLGVDIGKLAEEYAAQIETQVHSHMAELERQLAEQLARVNVPPEAAEMRGAEVAAQVRQVVERVSDKARRRAEAAQRRMERQATRSRHDWKWGFEAPTRGTPSPPPPPPAEPVSEAERLAILRMLAAGKVSVDEAEKLLAALEGRV